MLRRWLVTCGILVLLLLPSPGYGDLLIHPTQFEFKYIEDIPLPPGFEKCNWKAAGDMAFIRDKVIPVMDPAWTGIIWTIDAAIALILAGAVPAATAASAATATVGATVKGELIKTFFTNVFEDVVLGIGLKEWLLKLDPARYREMMTRLSDEFGMSDHFVWALAVSNHTRIPECTAVPLGARVFLHATSEKVPPELPTRIVCLKDRVVETQQLGSFVYEMSLDGKLQPPTVKRVFAYEAVNGKRIQDSGNPPQTLRVRDKDGGIEGRMILENLPGLGSGGLRELHVYSPVNKGVLDQKIDDYVFALVLSPETVEVESIGPLDLKPGKEIGLRVRIKGFHQFVPGPRDNYPQHWVSSSDNSHRWVDLANDVFKGAFCEGPDGKPLETRIGRNDSRGTFIYFKPKSEGTVKLLLKTLDGPVHVKEIHVGGPDMSKGVEKESWSIWALRDHQHGLYENTCYVTVLRTYYQYGDKRIGAPPDGEIIPNEDLNAYLRERCAFMKQLSGWTADGGATRNTFQAMAAGAKPGVRYYTPGGLWDDGFADCYIFLGKEQCWFSNPACLPPDKRGSSLLKPKEPQSKELEPAANIQDATDRSGPATVLEPATGLEPATEGSSPASQLQGAVEPPQPAVSPQMRAAWEGAVGPSTPAASPKPSQGAWAKAVDAADPSNVKRKDPPAPPVKKPPATDSPPPIAKKEADQKNAPTPVKEKRDTDSLLGTHWDAADDHKQAKATPPPAKSGRPPRTDDEVRQALESMGFKIVEKATFGALKGQWIEIADPAKATQFGFKERKRAMAGKGMTGIIRCWTERKGDQLIIWIDWLDVEIKDDSKLPSYVKLYAK
jgi:hypothetical protein